LAQFLNDSERDERHRQQNRDDDEELEQVAAQVGLPNRAWIRWWTGWNTTTSTVAQSSTSRNGWISRQHR
jgi:hypothetical protein